ncbi:hypothetical protein CPB84DRAFT_1749648 [Gymnopilus junonius]|uniref:Uncharacterized protein n=1 Tax=Gymnopilus junonius TaxID=109634 RepID=A0A9P5NJT8_GYMJU|nr:hypothetical protein CPB84DRAFT_1749648 [Gymnopilus junonius]
MARGQVRYYPKGFRIFFVLIIQQMLSDGPRLKNLPQEQFWKVGQFTQGTYVRFSRSPSSYHIAPVREITVEEPVACTSLSMIDLLVPRSQCHKVIVFRQAFNCWVDRVGRTPCSIFHGLVPFKFACQSLLFVFSAAGVRIFSSYVSSSHFA